MWLCNASSTAHQLRRHLKTHSGEKQKIQPMWLWDLDFLRSQGIVKVVRIWKSVKIVKIVKIGKSVYIVKSGKIVNIWKLQSLHLAHILYTILSKFQFCLIIWCCVHPQIVNNPCRFKNTSVFERASHVVGIQDFMILKELKIDWKIEVKRWKKITSGELNEVRPQIGKRKVDQDTTSPSKMQTGFIWLFWWFPLVCLVLILSRSFDIFWPLWYKCSNMVCWR